MDPTQPAAHVTATAAAHDMSFVSLVMQADPVVKSVLALLVVASLVCWTIIIDKSWRLVRARREARALAARIPAKTMAEIDPSTLRPGGSGINETLMTAALEAWRDEDPGESRAERRERIERSMRMVLGGYLRHLASGLPFLATTASAAPFIGLFGTVWGIMNAFTGIARSQDTSLAVVAPGIAEALFATAIGLAAAIPAAIAYNKLSSALGGTRHMFGASISRMSEHLARKPAPRPRALAAE